ncbi:MAG: hypothetical protein ACMXX6_00010 [Candidatus Woesearchaeota archaeon]
MWNFESLILSLQNSGFLTVILPFLLVFTLVFAILQKAKILGTDSSGKPRKNYNIVIAFVLGMGFVVPSITGTYPAGMDPVQIVNTAIPQVSVLIIAILMVLLLLGIFGTEFDTEKNVGGFIGILAVASVFIIFGVAAGWFGPNLPYWLSFLYDPQFQALVVAILVFGLVIYFITKEDDSGKGKNDGGFLKELIKKV